MPSQCPQADVLERLVLGCIDQEEASGLEAHVLGCERCAGMLHRVRAEDGLVAAMRGAARMPASSEAAEALIPWLKRLRPKDPKATLSVSDLTTPTPDPLTALPTYDFLEPPEAPDELGRLGKYRVLHAIGAGGMGMVFRAEDVRLQRPVALKVIKPELLQRADLHERFLSEARAVAAVEHENIVAVYEADDVAGVPYLAMPLLAGEPLENYLRRSGRPLPVAEILSIGRQVAAGLAAAHERGLIHRDVKPSNIWLQPVGSGQWAVGSERETAERASTTRV